MVIQFCQKLRTRWFASCLVKHAGERPLNREEVIARQYTKVVAIVGRWVALLHAARRLHNRTDSLRAVIGVIIRVVLC